MKLPNFNSKLCIWCQAHPRIVNERCYRCGHIDGEPFTRKTSRRKFLDPRGHSLLRRAELLGWKIPFIDEKQIIFEIC